MATLRSLEKLIEEKAGVQASKDWQELEQLLLQWFKDHPTKNRTTFYKGAANSDAMFDASGPRETTDMLPELNRHFRTFRARWIIARKEHLIEVMTSDLLKKVDLLGT